MLTNLSIGHYGRFANALFQISAVIGIARKSAQPYGFLPFVNHDHKERFGSTEDCELDKYFTNPLPRLAGDYPYFEKKDYTWGYHDIYLPTGNWDISGHFQSERYFKHCMDEVRHYFTMKDEVEMIHSVGIHVRRGDYDDLYHTIIGADYYRKAMDVFPKGRTQFIIFSDDIEKAESMFSLMGFPPSPTMIFSKSNDYIADFRAMKSLQHFICGNSSYSLMAAILGEHPDKKIVCPSQWFGPAWNPETKDLYPENAIII